MKRFIYKLHLEFLKLLVETKRFFVAVGRWSWGKVRKYTRITARVLLFGVYKSYVSWRMRLESNLETTQERVYLVTSNKFFIMGVASVTVLLIGLPHMRFITPPAYGAGSTSLLLAIVGPSDEESAYEEETADAYDTSTPVEYGYGAQPNDAHLPNEEYGIDYDLGYDSASVYAPVVAPGGTLLPSGSVATTVQPTAPSQGFEIKKYTVESGDTISSIAKKFGITQQTVMGENSLTSRSTLRVGQVLTILPVDGVVHTVKRGDTLAAIARQYGLKATDELQRVNQLNSRSTLSIGQSLVVPGGVRTVAVAPKPVANAGSSANTKLPPPVTGTYVPTNSGEDHTDEYYGPAKFRNQAKPAPSPNANAAGMIWPTTSKRINQYFSGRHSGLDVHGYYDSPLYASDDGVVKVANWRTNGYGFGVDIDHENGIVTRYGHASRLFVHIGQRVKKGDVIGFIGTTGKSTGPHLHFEVIVRGVRVNPFTYTR